MPSISDRERLGEEYLSFELGEMFPDQDTSRTLGPVLKFLKMHSTLAARLRSRGTHQLDPSVVDESEAARQELADLGINPDVFQTAYVIAEGKEADVLGW